jgi:hypothetical protein
MRYLTGGNSGTGSVSKYSNDKAYVINSFIQNNTIHSIVEWGVGDGKQLSKYDFNQVNYVGYDISKYIINKLNKVNKNENYKFLLSNQYHNEKYDLALSIEVIFHLIDDSIYENYMARLFNSSQKFVIIFSTNFNSNVDAHCMHHEIKSYISKHFKEFVLEKEEFIESFYFGRENEGKYAKFYFYKKIMQPIALSPKE